MICLNGRYVAYLVSIFAILAILFSLYALFKEPEHKTAAVKISTDQLTQDQLTVMQDKVLGHVTVPGMAEIISTENKYIVQTPIDTVKSNINDSTEQHVRVISPGKSLDDGDAGDAKDEQWKKMF